MNTYIHNLHIRLSIRLLLLTVLLIGAANLQTVLAQPTLSGQTFSVLENSGNGTQIGQLAASGGYAESLRLEAGTNVVDTFTPFQTTLTQVNFSSPFWRTPIVFSQIQEPGTSWITERWQTDDYLDITIYHSANIFYRTRQKNSSYNGFSVGLESPYRTVGFSTILGFGGSETVGWLAVEKAAQGRLDGMPFETFLTNDVVQSARKVSYYKEVVNFSAPFTQTPRILAGVATLKSNNQAGVWYDMNRSRIMLMLDDVSNKFDNLAGEAVSVLAVQQDGLLKDNSGTVIGEIGTIQNMNAGGQTITLQHTYTNPVVFVQPLSMDRNGIWVTKDYIFRFTNISANSFSGRLQQNGWDDPRWGNQDLHYFVFEAGTWEIPYQQYTYSITDGNGSGAFSIEPDTGILRVADYTQLDYESGITTYPLEITVTDSSGAAASAEVIVNIEDQVGDSLETDANITLSAQNAGDQLGRDVANAGDVNGDGLDDLIVGAPFADPHGGDSGRAYVVFSTGGPADIDLNAVASGNGGFVINGEAAGDYAGYGVAGAGDINGDGLADVLVGAPRANPNGVYSGKAYVVFGKTDTGAVELSDIARDDNDGGFVLLGAHAHDFSGGTVAIADVNGDGLDDIILGEQYVAPSEHPSYIWFHRTDDIYGDDNALVYVVFGKRDGGAVSLGHIRWEAGFVVTRSGRKLVLSGDNDWLYRIGAFITTGDINADGLADIVIGGGSLIGEDVYVVFGKSDSYPVTLDNLWRGRQQEGVHFFIDGRRTGSQELGWYGGIGSSPAAIGDVNGDGVDDMAIPVPNPLRHDGLSSPTVYVVFGSSDLGRDINLSTITSDQGFRIYQDSSVASDYIFLAQDAGDVNGDGLDDILIGSPQNKGALYLVYGSADSRDVYTSAMLAEGRGMQFVAKQNGAFLGWDISPAGDWNGDGIADFMAGAAGFDGAAGGDSGIVYGFLGEGQNMTQWGSGGADPLTGSSAADAIAAGPGDDMLTGNGGADVLYGGPGNDTIVISDTSVLRVDGGHGTDTLQLDGAGLHLDLRAAPARVRNVEIFDITGSGHNRISLTKTAGGLDPSVGHGRTIVKGDLGDRVLAFDQQWTPDGSLTLDGIVYNRYADSLGADLLVQEGVAVSLNTAPALPHQTFTVPESLLKGDLVGTIAVVDDDLGDVFRYRLCVNSSCYYDHVSDFQLTTDGKLVVAAPRLDYEKTAVYNLTVRVDDRFREYAVGIVTIVVEDEDTGADTQGDLLVDVDGESIWGSNVLTDLLGPSATLNDAFSENFADYSPVDGTAITMTMSGTVTGAYHLDLNGGTLNASLPLAYSISYPDEIQAGQPVTLNTSAALESGAAFTVTSPSFSADASIALNNFGFGLQTHFLSILQDGILPPDTYSSSLNLYEPPIEFPPFSIALSQSLSGNRVSATSSVSSANPLRLEANLQTPWVTKSQNYEWPFLPVDPSGGWTYCWEDPPFFDWWNGTQYQSLGDLVYGVTYTIVKSGYSATVSLAQNFAVELTPTATLTLEDGSTHTFAFIDGLTFTPSADSDVNGDGTITATLSLDSQPQFSNQTGLAYTLAHPFKAAEVLAVMARGRCETDAFNGHGLLSGGTEPLLFETFVDEPVGPMINLNPTLHFDDMLDPVTFPLEAEPVSLKLAFDLNQCSGADCDNTVPVASEVGISGDLEIPSSGSTQLNGTYTYSDADGDAEVGSQYRWFLAQDGTGIGSQHYSPFRTAQFGQWYAGYYVRFCVMPADGRAFGEAACSSWQGPLKYTEKDAVPPETTITAHPANPSSSSLAFFGFSGTDLANSGAGTVARYECRIDGSVFTTCTSPAEYDNLSDGWHTFEVRAVDSSGNVDESPASYTWFIDATPPVLTLPADATLEAVGPDGAVHSFNVGAVDAIDPNPVMACDPASGTQFPIGATTVTCTAADALGNSGSGSFTVTVQDTTAPETTITAHPDDPSSSKTAAFEFIGSDIVGVISYECQLDDSGFSACNSPQAYVDLADDQHTFEVRAIDAAGNVDSAPAVFTWVINTGGITPPPPATTVPEPATITLIGIGLVGVLTLVRRRRKIRK